jgi:hypothetical protein
MYVQTLTSIEIIFYVVYNIESIYLAPLQRGGSEKEEGHHWLDIHG